MCFGYNKEWKLRTLILSQRWLFINTGPIPSQNELEQRYLFSFQIMRLEYGQREDLVKMVGNRKRVYLTEFPLLPASPTFGASPVAQRAKRLPAMWETCVQSLGRENPMEKAMATHSSTLAWKIPWTEEPGGLLSMGSHRVGHNWRDLAAAAAGN